MLQKYPTDAKSSSPSIFFSNLESQTLVTCVKQEWGVEEAFRSHLAQVSVAHGVDNSEEGAQGARWVRAGEGKGVQGKGATLRVGQGRGVRWQRRRCQISSFPSSLLTAQKLIKQLLILNISNIKAWFAEQKSIMCDV